MNSHEFNTAKGGDRIVKDRKAKAKLIILLGIIWIIVTFPLPWIVNNPEVSESQFNTILRNYRNNVNSIYYVLGVLFGH